MEEHHANKEIFSIAHLQKQCQKMKKIYFFAKSCQNAPIFSPNPAFLSRSEEMNGRNNGNFTPLMAFLPPITFTEKCQIFDKIVSYGHGQRNLCRKLDLYFLSYYVKKLFFEGKNYIHQWNFFSLFTIFRQNTNRYMKIFCQFFTYDYKFWERK